MNTYVVLKCFSEMSVDKKSQVIVKSLLKGVIILGIV